MERAIFGVDHLEAGAWLAREWGLPDSLVEVIVGQNKPPGGGLNEVTLVRVACRLADFIGLSVQQCDTEKSFDEIAAPLPEWARPRLRAQLPAMKAAIFKEIGLSEAEENPKAADPVAEDDPSASIDVPPNLSASRGLPGGFLAMLAFLLLVAVLLLLRR
jgi:hypothetical protein